MAETEKKSLALQQIYDCMDALAAESPEGKVSVRKMLTRLKAGVSQAAANRVCRALQSDERFLDAGDETFVLKKKFFHGFEFLITPDEWEIENRLLVPGHRFAPFVSSEIFPSEVKLDFRQQEISAPLDKVFHYLFLLGSEQIFDFLVAEHPANRNVRQQHPGAAAPVVTLNVFDLTEFYRKHDFCYGDALTVRVLDYETGSCEIGYLSGAERESRERENSMTALDAAMKKVSETFEDYLEIPDELAYAFFFREGNIPLQRDISIDEYVKLSKQVELSFDSGHTVLRFRKPDSMDSDAALSPLLPPEGVGISRGNTDSPEAMLKEIGSMLTMHEIDGFILDACSVYALDFEEFFSRAFGFASLEFADDGQKAVFMNYLEDRFETMCADYNRVDDENKAPLRGAVMELVEERLEFLHHLPEEELKSDEVKELFRKLAAIAGQLNEVLGMLNDPAFTPEKTECEQLRDLIEQRAGEQADLIGERP